MFIIFTAQQSNRLTYILSYIFNEILGVSYLVTCNENDFKNSDRIKINYSVRDFSDSIQIRPNDLIFEKSIRPVEVRIGSWEHNPTLFHVSENPKIPFDIFAATFYLISRYEEYLPYEEDQHGRFAANQSIAHKGNFLHIPIVNEWIQSFKKLIEKKYSHIKWPEKSGKILHTFDVDFPFAYKGKGFLRNTGGLFKAIINLKVKESIKRMLTLLFLRRDHFYTYDYIRSSLENHAEKSIFFFLMGDYGAEDRSSPPKNKSFIRLIRKIEKFADIGVHPSYLSNTKPELIEKEVAILSSAINNPILKSRQHYLKIHLPATYRNLINVGIKEDHSMGFAESPGYRAGTCTPFFFYDLISEQETQLKIVPLIFMDATYLYYKNVSFTNAKNEIESILQKAIQHHGYCDLLWHNNNLVSDSQISKQLFDHFVKIKGIYY